MSVPLPPPPQNVPLVNVPLVQDIQLPAPPPIMAPGVDSVSLQSRLSDFWTDQPRVWFVRTEAILTPQRMSDEAKFDLVVSKLSKEVIAQVTDILLNPPPTHKYDALKARLLHIYEESMSRQIEKLMSELELGQQKPSQLLRRMRELATDKVPDETLRVLWQNRLPTQVRAVLTVSDSKDLDNLAAVADNVMEAVRPSYAAATTCAAPAPTSSAALDLALLRAEVAKIKATVNQIDQRRSRSRPPDRTRHRSQSRRRSGSRRPKKENYLCFYHYRFREKANKCTEPCAWKHKLPEN
ncbi:unnamed protein product [Parnassius mnemosyne]|uniref:DUF7041 domain-containing protein n=1 Tax=Parnassius mnemosyne TaxID=213953 RepID=A0AAV1LCW2_9NEOP